MAAVQDELPVPALPLPIFRISAKVERYMLYDINTVTWLRKEHQILGVLVGTLPQAPQQNVFLGLPLELMPEEARLLTSKGVAYIVDDRERHDAGAQTISVEQRRSYTDALAKEGAEAAMQAERRKLENTEKALRRLRLDTPPSRPTKPERNVNGGTDDNDASEELFDSKPSPEQSRNLPRKAQGETPWAMTPATASMMPTTHHDEAQASEPAVKASSFAVFNQLYDHGYFMSPGLRFGCQFTAYPGDPLRYHSHFLADGFDWDEEIDLIDIVSGGRLGTGVKKGFLLGGIQPGDSDSKDRTRTFCIEWGGM